MKSLILVLIGILMLLSFGGPATLAQDTESPSENTTDDIVDLTVDAAQETATTIGGFVERLVTVPQSDVARVLMVLGGFVLLVAGWRIFDSIIIVAGFLMGASIAAAVITTDSAFVSIIAIALGGFVGAGLAIFLYSIAVFLIGAYTGIILTTSIASALSLTPVSSIALLVGAILGGVILVGLSFELLVLLSAVVGAQMLSLGLGLSAVWTLLFAIGGIAIQFMMLRRYNYDFRRRRRPRI